MLFCGAALGNKFKLGAQCSRFALGLLLLVDVAQQVQPKPWDTVSAMTDAALKPVDDAACHLVRHPLPASAGMKAPRILHDRGHVVRPLVSR
jgi:hypothetical protein